MAFVIDKEGNYLPVLGESSGGGSGGDIGNGKITINQGGVKKGEFTVNQAGDETIDLDAGGGALTPAGSITQPIYISDEGVPTATTYSLAKSVPADADFTNTTYSAFTGADGTNAGAAGLVPAPAATDNVKLLRGDGTWGLDPNFLPDGTTINVKLDGTGDFTSLRSALAYIKGKFSNGSVIIKIGAGTFTDNDIIEIYCNWFNIPMLHIKGQSAATTILQNNNTTNGNAFLNIYYGQVKLENLTFLRPDGTSSTNYRGVSANIGSNISIASVDFKGCNWAVSATRGGNCSLQGTISIEDSKEAIVSAPGYINTAWGTNLIGKNIDKFFYVSSGGVIQLFGISKTFTNVTTVSSQAVGASTASGWIAGSIPS